MNIILDPKMDKIGYALVASDDHYNVYYIVETGKFAIYIKERPYERDIEYCVHRNIVSSEEVFAKIAAIENSGNFENLLQIKKQHKKEHSKLISERNKKALREGTHQFQLRPELQLMASESAQIWVNENREIHRAESKRAARIRCGKENKPIRYNFEDKPIIADDETLKSLYLGGMPIHKIAEKYSVSFWTCYNRIKSLCEVRSRSEILTKLWNNEEFAQSVMQAWKKTPNNQESEILSLIETCSKDFKYNGNCDLGITIGRKIPDFVNTNGKKQVILFNGCYWHQCPICFPKKSTFEEAYQELNDIDINDKQPYSDLGYKCLIIWGHELIDTQSVIDKIKIFIGR